MTEIRHLAITKTSAENDDLLLMQNPTTGETYNIKKSDFLAGLSSSGNTGSGGNTPSNINLTFATSGDVNGLFYYLGTAKGTQPWDNPTNRGLLISVSSIGVGFPVSLVNRDASEFYTNNAPQSWVAFDIGTSKLRCNYYLLRNRNVADHYLRSWSFQGSNDGSTWMTLDNQINNAVLNTPSQWLALPVVSNTPYSVFRLLQTGQNSAGYNYLCLGEVELYGEYIA